MTLSTECDRARHEGGGLGAGIWVDIRTPTRVARRLHARKGGRGAGDTLSAQCSAKRQRRDSRHTRALYCILNIRHRHTCGVINIQRTTIKTSI